MKLSDIKAQDKPLHILKSYIAQERLEGGYLFSGPQGVGKKLIALGLAKIVNCEKPGEEPCEECPSCKKIENSRHPDVHLIELEDDEIKIEFIRQLQREISFKAYEGKRKVFIIDNAHKLTAEASNALLKILEEPPKGSLMILISDKPSLLFKTIISRCKVVKFYPLKRAKLQEIMIQDYGLDKTLAHFLAYYSEGRLGSALRLKDTDILKEKNSAIDKFVFVKRPQVETLALKDKDEIKGMLNFLASWFRDMYFIKIGMPYSEVINLDRKDELLRSMSDFSFLDLNDIVESISEALLNLEQNINTRLLLYGLGVKLCKV
jgi:DNA polymerase III subunit delta'